MFAETMRRAITAAPRSQLSRIAETLWQAYRAGAIGDVEAQELAELVELRKKVPIDRPAPRRVGSRPRSSASLERRRRWVAAGLMPPALASGFTMGEAAALAVVAVESAKRRVCTLTIGAIAGAAGVSETTVRNALRAARSAGLLAVRERRVSRWRNDSNVVTIISSEWLAWLRVGPARGGCKFAKGTPTKDSKPAFAPFRRNHRIERIGPYSAENGFRELSCGLAMSQEGKSENRATRQRRQSAAIPG